MVACGIHSAMLVALWRNHTNYSAEAPAPTEDSEWELDVTPPEETSEEREQALAIQRPPASAAGGRTTARDPSAVPGSPESTTGSLETGPAEPATPSPSSSASPSGSGWTFSPGPKGPVDLGLGSARNPKLLPPGAVGKVDIPADERPSTSGGMLEMLDAEDAKRGFGRGGPVKLAVEAAARTTDAPMAGKAVYDISVGKDGLVQINLVNATSDFDGWSQIIAAIRGHLAKKHLRIPPDSKGLHVVVEIEAHEQYPDGSRPSDSGARVGMGPNGPGASYRGKVGGIGLGPGGLGGMLTPENSGVAATRVVSSRIVRETRL